MQSALRVRKITQGHARALLPLGDDREQKAFCERVQSEGLSVRATEELVRRTIREADADPLKVVGADPPTRKPARPRSEHLAALEQEFRAALGTRVDIREGRRGRGKIVIHFKNHAEFDRLRGELNAPPAKPKVRQAG